jgi:hypothetical protein
MSISEFQNIVSVEIEISGKMSSMIIVVHIRKDFCNVKICFEEALDPSNIIIKKKLDFGLIFLYVSEYWASK